MEDRRFTEIDLRRILQRASGRRDDVVEGGFIETRHRGKAWDVIVEPDQERQLLVIAAYPVWE